VLVVANQSEAVAKIPQILKLAKFRYGPSRRSWHKVNCLLLPVYDTIAITSLNLKAPPTPSTTAHPLISQPLPKLAVDL